jgi:hypothetical protein
MGSLSDFGDEDMLELDTFDGIVDPTFNNDYTTDTIAEARSVDLTVEEELSEDETSLHCTSQTDAR